MTPPTDALVDSISGASAVTVMVSSSVPTSSRMSRPTNCCVLIRTPCRSNERNPCTRYLDGVGVGFDRRERIFAGRVGDRLSRRAVGFVEERDRDAGNHPLRVLDNAAEATLRRLSSGETGDQQGRDRYCSDRPCPETVEHETPVRRGMWKGKTKQAATSYSN